METTSVLTYIGYAGLILFVVLAIAAAVVFFRFDIRAVRADLSGKAKQRALAEQGSASTVRRKARPNAGADEPVWSGEVNQGAAAPSDSATQVGTGSDGATSVARASDGATSVARPSDGATSVARRSDGVRGVDGAPEGATQHAAAAAVSAAGAPAGENLGAADGEASAANAMPVVEEGQSVAGDDFSLDSDGMYAASAGGETYAASAAGQEAADQGVDDQALADFLNAWAGDADSDGAVHAARDDDATMHVSDDTVFALRDVAAEAAADAPDAGDATVTALRGGADDGNDTFCATSGDSDVTVVAEGAERAAEGADEAAEDFKLTVNRVVVGSNDIIDPDAEGSAGA